MVAAARKPKVAASESLLRSRKEEDAYFDELLKNSEERRRRESPQQRLERANRQTYVDHVARQEWLEQGRSANTRKQNLVQERLEAEAKLYIDYRARKPRARADAVHSYILRAINRRKGVKKISLYTLTSRDLPALRAEGKIPKYHLIPYEPQQ
jgi:hypothetical protein